MSPGPKCAAEKDGGGVNIPCNNIKRVDYETLTCMYPDGGAGGCTDRNVYDSSGTKIN